MTTVTKEKKRPRFSVKELKEGMTVAQARKYFDKNPDLWALRQFLLGDE